ncbi:MAG: MFS transporter, partial [Myxococcota bacterium]
LLALINASSAGWYAILKGRLYTEFPGRSGTALAVSTVFNPVGLVAPILVGAIASVAGLETAFALLAVGPVALVVGVPTGIKQP